MATYHGNDGQVLIGANAILEITDFEYTVESTLAEDSAQGDAARTFIAGKSGATGTINCWQDSDDSTGQALMDPGDSAVLLLHPEGTGSGLVEYSVPAIINSATISSEHESIVSVSFSFTRNGAHTQSNQA